MARSTGRTFLSRKLRPDIKFRIPDGSRMPAAYIGNWLKLTQENSMASDNPLDPHFKTTDSHMTDKQAEQNDYQKNPPNEPPSMDTTKRDIKHGKSTPGKIPGKQ
jgi:hypothetical protein